LKKLTTSNLEKLARLVRKRYKEDADYRKRTVLMSGLNFIEWCDVIDMMMRKEHEPEEQAAIPDMKRYFGLGVTRIDATVAWRQDLLLNTAEAPFTLRPTPIPTLAPQVVSEVSELIMNELWARVNTVMPVEQLVAGGMPIDPVQRFIKEQAPKMKATKAEYLNREANKLAMEAEVKIRDLTEEGGWRKAFWEMQAMQTLYPTAIMCGPEVVPSTIKTYSKKGAVQYTQGKTHQWRTVNPRMFYFGTDSTNANDGRGCTEIRFKSRARLIACMSNQYYDAKAVKEVLDEFHNSSRDWLSDTYNEGFVDSWALTPNEEIPVLVHYGQISGGELLDAKISGVDRYTMYEVRIEVVGSQVIYCQLSEFNDAGTGMGVENSRPYFASSWKVNHGSPYGRSLGMLLRDPQLILNRLHYYMMSNAYNAHLPMIELAGSRIASPSDWFYQPGAAFETRSESKIEGETSGIRMHHTMETFRGLSELFVNRMRMVDDEIGITAASYGSMMTASTNDKTLGGQLQRISGSARGLKDAIYNQDLQIIEPSIQRSIALLQKSGEIMGDINVKARGAASLIQKDVIQQQQQQILPVLAQAAQTMPDFQPAQKELLTQIFSNMGVPRDVLPSSTMEKEFMAAGLAGRPATPQMQADGRSLNADQIGGKL
jgi:hypothetical protein